MGITDRFISTPNVGKFYVFDPRPKDIHIEDIAYMLSRNPRFGGGTKGEPLSLAEHSWNVKRVIEEMFSTDYTLQMAALMHDASEAYVGDLVHPIKYAMPSFRRLEDKLLRVIFEALKIPWPDTDDWDTIKIADDIMLVTERNAVHNYHGLPWEIDNSIHAVPRPDIKIECRPWREARKEFLKQYNRLRRKIDETTKSKTNGVLHRCAA